MAASPQIATLTALQGGAESQAPDGGARPLQVGSALHEGEILVTAQGAQADIRLEDGTSLQIGGGRSIALTAELGDHWQPDAGESALGAGTLADLHAALGAIGTVEVAPLPGAGGEHAAGDFVQLLRLAEAGAAFDGASAPDILPWTLADGGGESAHLSLLAPADAAQALDVLDLLTPAGDASLGDTLPGTAGAPDALRVDADHDASGALRDLGLQHLELGALGGDHQQIIDNLLANGKLNAD